jgi:hypothetical protein
LVTKDELLQAVWRQPGKSFFPVSFQASNTSQA